MSVVEKTIRKLQEQRQQSAGEAHPPAAKFAPVFPNRPLLVIGSFFLALGAGIGVAYLLHLLRPVFISSRQLTAATGLPVLGAVSMAWAEKYRVERRRSAVRYALASTGLLVATAAVFIVSIVRITPTSSGGL